MHSSCSIYGKLVEINCDELSQSIQNIGKWLK